jgi:hypothetical protein
LMRNFPVGKLLEVNGWNISQPWHLIK